MFIEEKYRRIIAKCPIFSGNGRYSETDISEALKAEKKQYDKGDLIHKSEEPFLRFGILLEGSAQA
ncbi:MAG: hypothetical protein IKI68_02285, partial [Clostridia bacterium]|nr:hypothetical protein [Clostridia bacterium]